MSKYWLSCVLFVLMMFHTLISIPNDTDTVLLNIRKCAKLFLPVMISVMEIRSASSDGNPCVAVFIFLFFPKNGKGPFKCFKLLLYSAWHKNMIMSPFHKATLWKNSPSSARLTPQSSALQLAIVTHTEHRNENVPSIRCVSIKQMSIFLFHRCSQKCHAPRQLAFVLFLSDTVW